MNMVESTSRIVVVVTCSDPVLAAAAMPFGILACVIPTGSLALPCH